MKLKKDKKKACPEQCQKVLVAMSGGVDSSVTAALLKKQEFDVSGVFMRLNNFSKKSEQDAKKVAKKLNIPFFVWDFQKEFKKKVIDYFIDEYQCGHTPNPCVECNKFIKFGILLERAKKMGFDYLATGHYVRINQKLKIKNQNDRLKIYELLKAKDEKKDQSYFLWQLNQKQLGHVLFPIGDYKKEEVRKIAKEMKLPVFDKRDSQEVCFIKNADTCGFLRARIRIKKGSIINKGGEKIGEHEGLAYYTIGQRKGIKISGSKPFYVVAKDYKKNALIVSESEKDLLKKEIIVDRVKWVSSPFIGECRVKIRSTAEPVIATIKKISTKSSSWRNKIIFKTPQRAIASGQSAVFYSGDKLLGGGIII
jgi:tRNA-specific 2-thiouridylase